MTVNVRSHTREGDGMDEAEREQRIERRRQVVALIRAMHESDATTDELIASLSTDSDIKRVIGAMAVAGSTLADSLAKTTGRSASEVLDELEKGLRSAPVE